LEQTDQRTANRSVLWRCRCDCGKEVLLARNVLTSANTSGARGVYFNKQRKKWIAQIMFRGQCHYLGGFDDFDEAVEARKQGEEMFFDVLRAHQGEKQSQAEK
ncbi:MAG: hypothetical protein UDP13_05690, partial [Butyricicoccus sp.]|nr:hypothetical protein [Butyricicoccus sp.]